MLYSNQKQTAIAEQDITCYKWLYMATENEHVTTFTETFVPKDVVCGSTPFVAQGGVECEKTKTVDTRTQKTYNFIYSSGLIHTFADKNAEFIAPNYRYEQYECVIPKGTEYVVGENIKNDIQFASKKIVFKKMIRRGAWTLDMEKNAQKAKNDFVYGEEAAKSVEQKRKPVCDFRKSKEDENKEMAYSIVGSTSILTTDTLFESLIKIAGWKDTSYAKSIVACLEKIAQIETTDEAVIQKVTNALKDILK